MCGQIVEMAARQLSEGIDDDYERGIESDVSSGAILAIALGSTALFMLCSYIVKWSDGRTKRTERLSKQKNERYLQNSSVQEKQKTLTRDRNNRGLPPQAGDQSSSMQDGAQYTVVKVPEGSAGGDTIKVSKPGTADSIAISVPAGLRAGDSFKCLLSGEAGSAGLGV